MRGLPLGVYLPFVRPLRYLSTVCRIGVPLFLVLGSAVSQAWAQSTMPTGATSCLSIPPSFVPFSSIYYVSAPNANGDRLVVGNMPLIVFSTFLSQILAASAPNQPLCSPLQATPGLYTQAYVPTAAERYGDFSDFQGLLLDPLTARPSAPNGDPFPGGIIPFNRLPGTFAWRIRAFTGAPAPALRFVPVTPCRVADTRNTVGPFGGPLLSKQTARVFTIPQSNCGIPTNAQAYSLNFTVVPAGKLNYITVFPTGQLQPLASTLNSYDGRIKANAAVVPAGNDGAVTVFTTDDTQLVIDINGYFVPATTNTALAFYPVTPCRLVDTRGAAGPLGAPSLSAQQERTFPVLTSACNVPAAAQAYALNYTVVPKTPLSWLTTWPAGQQRPFVSTLNAPTSAITANAALVPAGDNGDVSVYVTNDTDLIIDISGYFAPPATGGLSLYNLVPCRVYDSRMESEAQPIVNSTAINVAGSNCNAPANAHAYIFNATAVPTSSLLYLTLWPHGSGEQPIVSTLNALDGVVSSNMAIVPTTDGSINAFASHSTHLIFDISGYFAP